MIVKKIFCTTIFQIYKRRIIEYYFQLRSVLAHIGLVMCSIAYVCLGAFLFHRIERPNEIMQRLTHRARYETLKMVSFKFITYLFAFFITVKI